MSKENLSGAIRFAIEMFDIEVKKILATSGNDPRDVLPSMIESLQDMLNKYPPW